LILTGNQDDPDMEHKRLLERHRSLRETGIALAEADGVFPGGGRHTHDVVELFCVRSGRGVDHLGDARRRLRPGTVGIVHYTQGHTFSGGPLAVVNLFLDLTRIPLPEVGELQGVLHAILPMHPSLRHRRGAAIHLDLPLRCGHLDILDAMLAEQAAAGPGHREALHAHLRLFLILLARHAAAAGFAGPGRADDTPDGAVERVRQRLDGGFTEPVRLPDLARLAGCAEATLSRGFRRHTGESVLRYVHRLRIDAARRRLASTDDPVTEVARACGFNDQAFFNRVFRRLAGCTPLAWRRRALGNP
jgi:AraC-like DNA-binding protein